MRTSEEVFSGSNFDYDAIVIGAGISGLYQLYRLRESGVRVCAFESGTGVGGTWYWNRYPGARFDSESYSYAYSFSQELLDEWDWSEHFSSQPEILSYLQYVADKFDLLKDIQFSSNVRSAIYDEDSRRWQVEIEDGNIYRTRFLITALGVLSEPTLPKIKGMESFGGRSFHTARWPHEPVDFHGRRVAVIGTGASGVQTIQEIAKDVGHLTVFQRRPNWCAPLNNGKIKADEMREIKANYPDMFELCRQTQGGFVWSVDPRGTFEVTLEERIDFWEGLYASRGMSIWQGNFRDVLIDPEANRALSDFVADKIRGRVDDPEIAEMLIPQDHGFGTRRVPLETRYYEAYNQQNIKLIDINNTPIEKITENGILTTDREFRFDLIVYATGFNGITGSYERINIQGVNGCRLKDQWETKLETFLGIHVPNFPNMFMINGPQGMGGNHPRNIEYNVEWITNLINYMRERNLKRAETTSEAVRSWVRHIKEKSKGLLSNQVDSWTTGINSNIEGKQTRILGLRYSGSAQSYRSRCDGVAASGYKELHLS
ncbi:MAG: flavin-containing monooxygenase [Dehalococcoidia bacterium]